MSTTPSITNKAVLDELERLAVVQAGTAGWQAIDRHMPALRKMVADLATAEEDARLMGGHMEIAIHKEGIAKRDLKTMTVDRDNYKESLREMSKSYVDERTLRVTAEDECEKHYTRLASLLYGGALNKVTAAECQAWEAEYIDAKRKLAEATTAITKVAYLLDTSATARDTSERNESFDKARDTIETFLYESLPDEDDTQGGSA